jgi:hypothetical protein
MPDNFQKLWVQKNLNAHAASQAAQAIQATGRALPCQVTAVDGSIVTVTFEVTGPWTLPDLTLPKAESQWLRAPTQVGDFGMTMPADTFLGGISGLGTGVADLTVDYGNMTTLVFVPVAATSFPAAPDPDKAWVNGPGGARLGDTQNGVYIDCDVESGTVTIAAGGQTWTFDATGFTMSTGIVAETHVHGGVATGAAETLEPSA